MKTLYQYDRTKYHTNKIQAAADNAPVPPWWTEQAPLGPDYRFNGQEWKKAMPKSDWMNRPQELGRAKQNKYTEIEAERVRRTELMPYTTPDGVDVEVKLREESPSKPRQTWLSGKANKADSRIRRGLGMDDVDGDKYLIAADDSRHAMTADDWLDLGERMDSWITGHVFAAGQHMANVRALTSMQDVIDYDYSTGWPT
jgi:hypothetical protein